MSSRILAGRYELIEKIGDGGMAVVYKARCRLLNRFVAVKILKPEFTHSNKFIENFKRESQQAASLNHQNIVNVYDVGREGGINYIVMELIEGQPLSDIISKRAPLRADDVILVAKQVASALSFAHKNHIIHRDVKPHNILITRDGTAKITDFGIAKAMNEEGIDEKTSTVIGSVHYFSPEQASGGYVDEKSDIYSLGIVIYEMLTGKVPFDGETPVSVAMKQVSEEIVPPSRIVKNIPYDLEKIVMKATDKHPVNRYHSADEMLDALNNASLDVLPFFDFEDEPKKKDGLDATTMINLVNKHEEPEETPVIIIKDERTFAGNEEHEVPLEEESEHEPDSAPVPESRRKARKNKKQRSPYFKVKVLAIIVALIVAIPVSSFLFQTLGTFSLFSDEVIVPKVIGMEVSDAKKELEDCGLKMEVGETVTDTDQKPGKIASQDPGEEMKVKKGTKVVVNVSAGEKGDLIPSVVGLSESDAISLLESYGYKKGKVTREFSDSAEGTVISQDPLGNEKGKEGDKIDLVVSKGKEVVTKTMPRLTGMTLDKAKDILKREGLTLDSKIEYKESTKYEKGIVMEQSIPAGESIDSDNSVKLTISKGAPEPVKKNKATVSIPYDKAGNEVFYLTVMVSDENGVTTPVNYQQRMKSGGSEKMTLNGSGQGKVQVYFDNALVDEYSVNFDTGEVR